MTCGSLAGASVLDQFAELGEHPGPDGGVAFGAFGLVADPADIAAAVDASEAALPQRIRHLTFGDEAAFAD